MSIMKGWEGREQKNSHAAYSSVVKSFTIKDIREANALKEAKAYEAQQVGAVSMQNLPESETVNGVGSIAVTESDWPVVGSVEDGEVYVIGNGSVVDAFPEGVSDCPSGYIYDPLTHHCRSISLGKTVSVQFAKLSYQGFLNYLDPAVAMLGGTCIFDDNNNRGIATVPIEREEELRATVIEFCILEED